MILYCGGGIFLNAARGRKGWLLVPNVGFLRKVCCCGAPPAAEPVPMEQREAFLNQNFLEVDESERKV